MTPHSLAAVSLALALGCGASRPSPPTATPGAPGAAQAAAAGAPRVVADERGFTPGELALARGGPGVVVFRRTSDDTCATAVVFPELGIERELPLGEDVALQLPAGEPRTLAFQCGMGMYRSRVVVR